MSTSSEKANPSLEVHVFKHLKFVDIGKLRARCDRLAIAPIANNHELKKLCAYHQRTEAFSRFIDPYEHIQVIMQMSWTGTLDIGTLWHTKDADRYILYGREHKEILVPMRTFATYDDVQAYLRRSHFPVESFLRNV